MRYWCTIYFLLLFSITQAQGILGYLHVEKDSDFNAEIKNAVFQPLDDFNFGLENGCYWVKIDHLPGINDNVISIEGHHISSITGYTNSSKLLPAFKQARYPSLYVNSQASFPVFIKIKVEHEAYLPIHFYSRSDLERQQKYSLFGNGLFYGALLFISIIMVLLFTVTGEDNFWTYAILLICIGIALAFRDNIPYLFGWRDAFYYNLELATHILIGIFGGYFTYSFIDLRDKKSTIGKTLIFLFAGSSTIGMFCYWFFGDFIYYAVADVLIFFSIVSLWVVSFSLMKKTTHLYWVFGIFAINIYFIFEFLVLYNFGYTLLNLSPATIKTGILAEMLILCFALLIDWHRSKQQALRLRIELNKRGKELQLLSQYKREDDLKDTYLENLIENHGLSNKEVKVLLLLSKGYTETRIAHELNINEDTLKATTRSLYAKIGIGEDEEMDLI